MKSLLRLLLISFISPCMFSQTAAYTVMLETNMGTMKCILYNVTPIHADNFVKLAREGFYDGQLFHRVISGFMIQAGDPNSKSAQKGQVLGHGNPGYTIPGEFYSFLYHKKGAIGAARQGDDINPNRESSGSQFYIVQGTVLSDNQMNAMEASRARIKFTPEQRAVYKTIGGTPHLDYAYSVFGEVIEGLEVIDKIASAPTDRMNRPVEDVKIIKVTVVK